MTGRPVDPPPFDPLPVGTALCLLGLAVAGMTFATLGMDYPTYSRTEWTARLAMMLAAPAIVLYALGAGSPGRGAWWRAFWTAGMAAYLLHFWWAVFGAYGGDIGAIVERQGWVAGTNALATILWVADVAAAWLLEPPPGSAVRILHLLTWLIVTISFIVASAVFRTGVSAMFGDLLALLVAGALAIRWAGRHAAKDVSSRIS
jgi:hypothetical protein